METPAPLPPSPIISTQFLCRGNLDAARFCEAFHDFCHTLDDLLDRDNPEGIQRDRVVRVMLTAVLEFSMNAFFQANRAGLLSLISQSFIAWGDSMDWQDSGDARKIRDADVIKGLYHEVFFHVALLCGGYDHARAVTRATREYDHEPGTE